MGKNKKKKHYYNSPKNDYSFEKSRFFERAQQFGQYLSIITYENIIRYHDGKLSEIQEEDYERYGLYQINKLAVAFWWNKTLRGDRLHLGGYCPDDDSFVYEFRDTDGCYSDMQEVHVKVFLSNDKPAFGIMLPEENPGVWKYYNTANEVAYAASVAMNIPDLKRVELHEYTGEFIDHENLKYFGVMSQFKKIRSNKYER